MLLLAIFYFTLGLCVYLIIYDLFAEDVGSMFTYEKFSNTVINYFNMKNVIGSLNTIFVPYNDWVPTPSLTVGDHDGVR